MMWPPTGAPCRRERGQRGKGEERGEEEERIRPGY